LASISCFIKLFLLFGRIFLSESLLKQKTCHIKFFCKFNIWGEEHENTNQASLRNHKNYCSSFLVANFNFYKKHHSATMLPIQLKLKGIYSYQEEEQTIDFARLTSDKLFGIFGKVGSGKSTILEAMMLALYNKTERLEGRGEVNYNLMNLQSKELGIEFIFKAGSPIKTYRFTVATKRNRKQFSIVKSITHSQYELDEATQEWMPKKIKAEDILKLSYENFKRAVIIPQGKFQEFLQLTDAKRAEMMMAIFQLEKFDLQNNAKLLAQKNSKKLNNLQSKLEELVVSPELIKNTKRQITELNKQIVDVDESLKKQAEQLKQLDALQEDWSDLSKLQTNKEKLDIDKKSKDSILEWTKSYYNCRNQFSVMQEKLKSKHKIREGFKNEIQDKEEKRNQIVRDINNEEKAFLETKLKYPNIEILEAYQQEWTNAIDIKELEAQISKGNKVLTKQHEKHSLIVEKTSQLQESLKSKKQLFQLVERQQIAEQLIKQFVKQLNRFGEDLEISKKNKIKVQEESKNILGDHKENELLEKLDNSKEGQELKKLFGNFQEKKQILTAYDFLVKYQEKIIGETQEEKTAFEKSDFNQKDIGETNLTVLQQKVKKEILEVESHLSEAELNLAKSSQTIEHQKSSLQEKNTTFKYKIEELKHIGLEKINDKTSAEISNLIEILSKEKKQYLEYESNIESLQKHKGELDSFIKTRQKDYKGTDKEYKEFHTKYKTAVTQSEFKDFSTIKGYLSNELSHVKADEEDAIRFQRKYDDVISKIAVFKDKIGNEIYEVELHEKVKKEVAHLQNQLDQIKGLLSVAEANFGRFTEELERKKEMSKEFEALDIRQKNLRTIEGLLKAKGFVNYVSGLKLKDLTKAANSRFQRMTHNQLSLLLNDKNNFEIQDNLNGGELRSIKTLSGGQTFQASLSLAIALADIVNAHHGEQSDFFFLDEGFGSLDTDSLRIVFQTLQSLRKENKIVGVISHVESLQEEIPTFLNIKNTEKGSEIACSWE